jgi:RHS repeat-associated protein
MDNFTYHYQQGTNQLTHVSDNVTVVPDDGNPDLTNQNANNYTYNSIGQLLNNAQDKIAYTYNTSGLVTRVESTDPAVNYSIEFAYNDRNHRTRKRVLQDGNTTDTYYVRDAAGQVMAIYNDVVTSNGSTVVKEYPIYGASRLGVDNGGNKRYEITDHLGNVRAVVQHPTTIIDGGGGTPTEVVVFEDDFNDGTVDPWLSYPLPSQPVPVIDNGRLKMTLVPGNQGVPGAYTPINFLAGHEYLISMVIKGTPSQTFIGGIQTTNNTDNQSVSFSQQGSQSMTFTTNETATYNLYFAPIPSNSAPSYLLSIDDVKIRDLTAEGDLPPDETTITSELLLMYRDYFPFGMVMPDLNTEGDYRYAFQGQEKDPETGKEAFELRLWDARIGRWLTTDPKRIHHSPYLGMANNPIRTIDPDGGAPDWINNGDGTYTAEKGDSAWSLADDAGIPYEQALEIMASQGYGTYVDLNDNVLKSAVDRGQVVTVFSTTQLDGIILTAKKNHPYKINENLEFNLRDTDYGLSSWGKIGSTFNPRGTGGGIVISGSLDAHARITYAKGNYFLNVDGFFSGLNHPNTKVKASLNIKYSSDISLREATKSFKLSPNKTMVTPISTTYIGSYILILPKDPNDITRLNIIIGVHQRLPGGGVSSIGLDANLLTKILN